MVPISRLEASRLKSLLRATLVQQQDEVKDEAATGEDDKNKNHKWGLVPQAVESEVERVAQALEGVGRTKLATMFRNCFVSTLKTTTLLMPNGHTHVFTGDIPAMWLRDSAAQVNHYISLAPGDLHLQVIIEGLIKRQANRILLDPYANAYRDKPLKASIPEAERRDGKTAEIWERKYEVDSLCYFLSLSYKYWKTTGVTSMFDDEWLRAAELVVTTWTNEQNHNRETSPYKYHHELPRSGIGAEAVYTGMTWSGFRPSDDPCKLPYLVPSNMFAVITLGYLSEIATAVYGMPQLSAKALELQKEIDDGIHKHAVINHQKYGRIYAYEVDGRGNHVLMDDANVPSLLSIPYLGYVSAHDPTNEIANNTRQFVLSSANPFFYSGKLAKGVGSPHTYRGYVWHIALTMQAMTATDDQEVLQLISTCENTDAGTGVMHESFHPDNPKQFSRPWFAWANSLFGELVRDKLPLLLASPKV